MADQPLTDLDELVETVGIHIPWLRRLEPGGHDPERNCDEIKVDHRADNGQSADYLEALVAALRQARERGEKAERDRDAFAVRIEAAWKREEEASEREVRVLARAEKAEAALAARVPVGSAALVVDGDSILLGRRAKEPNFGRWVMPGGKVEPGETITDAAVREVHEETGLDVEIVSRLGTFEIVDPVAPSVFVLSEASVIGGSLSGASDLAEARFVPRSELAAVDLSEPCRDALREVGWLAAVSGDEAETPKPETRARQLLGEVLGEHAEAWQEQQARGFSAAAGDETEG